MTGKSYEDGRRDGQAQAHEKMLSRHEGRLDAQAERIARLEKTAWAMFGIIALIETAPALKAFFGAGG